VVTIARGVAVVAQVTDRQVTASEAPLKLGLEGRITEQSLTLAAADEHDDAALGGVDKAGGELGEAGDGQRGEQGPKTGDTHGEGQAS
jgi:hypothetical protein